MRLVSVVFLAVISMIFVSCGIARSTSSIWKAEAQREESLKKIVVGFAKEDILEIDEFGKKSLSKKAADDVSSLEKRRAAYYFYKADAYLSKAYDFRAKSIYDSSEYLANRAIEFFIAADSVIDTSLEKTNKTTLAPASEVIEQVQVTVEPVPQENLPDVGISVSPEQTSQKDVVIPESGQPVNPIENETTVPQPQSDVPSQEPSVVPVAEPSVVPVAEPSVVPVAEPDNIPENEEKPSLKGDPFAKDKQPEEKAKKEEKKPSYYDVYEEMRQKYLKKQEEEKEKEKLEEEKKRKKQEEKAAPEGGVQ